MTCKKHIVAIGSVAINALREFKNICMQDIVTSNINPSTGTYRDVLAMHKHGDVYMFVVSENSTSSLQEFNSFKRALYSDVLSPIATPYVYVPISDHDGKFVEMAANKILEALPKLQEVYMDFQNKIGNVRDVELTKQKEKTMTTKKHILAFGSEAIAVLNNIRNTTIGNSARYRDTVFGDVDLSKGVDLSQHTHGDAYMFVVSEDDEVAAEAARVAALKFKSGILSSIPTPWIAVTVSDQDGLFVGPSGAEKIQNATELLHKAWMSSKDKVTADHDSEEVVVQMKQDYPELDHAINAQETTAPATDGKVVFFCVGDFVQEMVKGLFTENPQWDNARITSVAVEFEQKDSYEQVQFWLSQLITRNHIRPQDKCILLYEESAAGLKELQYTRELISKVTNSNYGEVCFPPGNAKVVERRFAHIELTEQIRFALEAIGGIKPLQESVMNQEEKKEEFAPIQVVACTSSDAYEITCKIFDGMSHENGLHPYIVLAYNPNFFNMSLQTLHTLHQSNELLGGRHGPVFDMIIITNGSAVIHDSMFENTVRQQFGNSINILGYKIFSVNDKVAKRQEQIVTVGEELRERQRQYVRTVEVAPVPSHGFRDFSPPVAKPTMLDEEQVKQSTSSLSDVLQERNPQQRVERPTMVADNAATEIDPRIMKILQNNAQVFAEFRQNVTMEINAMHAQINHLAGMRGINQSMGDSTAFGQPQLRHPAGLPSGYGQGLMRRFGNPAPSGYGHDASGMYFGPPPKDPAASTREVVKELAAEVKLMITVPNHEDFFMIRGMLMEMARRYPGMRKNILLVDPFVNTVPLSVFNAVLDNPNIPVVVAHSEARERGARISVGSLRARRQTFGHLSNIQLIGLHALPDLVTGYMMEDKL